MASIEDSDNWFHVRLKDKGRSVRDLSRHLDIDPSSASRMLRGERKMKVEEASQIAIFLGVTVNEVLNHAGASIDIDGSPTRVVLTSMIDEAGTVKRLPEPKPLPHSVIDRAHAAISRAGNGKIVAAQVRATNGPLSSLDDAIVLFAHTDSVEAGAIGTMSVFRAQSGEQHFGRVLSVRKTGEATIVRPDGSTEECILSTATPVLAIIP